MKLSPPHRSPALPHRVLIIVILVLIVVVVVLLLVVVVLLLVWLVLLVRLGLLIVQPKVDEDVQDVVLQGGGQPPALLGELGVVCHCVLHLLLLRPNLADAVREIRDAPEDRVLIVEAC